MHSIFCLSRSEKSAHAEKYLRREDRPLVCGPFSLLQCVLVLLLPKLNQLNLLLFLNNPRQNLMAILNFLPMRHEGFSGSGESS